MGFYIALVPSTLTPFGPAWDARAREVVEAVGAQRPGEGVDVRLSSGLELKLYDQNDEPGAMIELRNFDTAASEFIYLLAASTECFVVAADLDVAFRMSGSAGEPHDGFRPIVITDSPDMLAKQLHAQVEAWAGYRDQAVVSHQPPAPEQKPDSLFIRLFGGRTT